MLTITKNNIATLFIILFTQQLNYSFTNKILYKSFYWPVLTAAPFHTAAKILFGRQRLENKIKKLQEQIDNNQSDYYLKRSLYNHDILIHKSCCFFRESVDQAKAKEIIKLAQELNILEKIKLICFERNWSIIGKSTIEIDEFNFFDNNKKMLPLTKTILVHELAHLTYDHQKKQIILYCASPFLAHFICRIPNKLNSKINNKLIFITSIFIKLFFIKEINRLYCKLTELQADNKAIEYGIQHNSIKMLIDVAEDMLDDYKTKKSNHQSILPNVIQDYLLFDTHPSSLNRAKNYYRAIKKFQKKNYNQLSELELSEIENLQKKLNNY